MIFFFFSRIDRLFLYNVHCTYYEYEYEYEYEYIMYTRRYENFYRIYDAQLFHIVKYE